MPTVHPDDSLDEVLLEFTRIGNVVKVCAVDPRTRTEVVIQGPISAGEEALRRTAINKLRYVIRRGGQGTHRP